MGPGRTPSPVFHCQGHLLEVAWVPVDKRRIDRLVVIDHRLGLRGCLAESPSWRENPSVEVNHPRRDRIPTEIPPETYKLRGKMKSDIYIYY